MNRIYAIAAVFATLAGAGCNPMATDAPTRPRPAPTEARRPAPPVPTASRLSGGFEMKADTPHDRVYAEYLRDKSGGMLRGARVGVEHKQLVEVKLDKSVPPEDTMDLTKSLLSGIRKEFPGKPFRLKIYDPKGKAILTAHYDPNEGVRYQIAHKGADRHEAIEDRTASNAPPPPAPDPDSANASETTERDEKFQKWAMNTGSKYLRYVNANLEHEGKLWFGVTQAVKPEDLKGLTRSLLEGAQKEFPRREIVATVFDPNGDKVGHAKMSRDGSIDWMK